VELDLRYKEIISMHSDVVYNSKLNVVSAKATGVLNYEVGKGLVEKILKVAANHKCHKVFCDYSKTQLPASILEIYDNADHFEQWGVPHNFWIAVFYSEDQKVYKFWETVVRNRGFAARVFNDKKVALKWLTNIS
jgi:hypothetical protein